MIDTVSLLGAVVLGPAALVVLGVTVRRSFRRALSLGVISSILREHF